jgi:hypothetical protein
MSKIRQYGLMKKLVQSGGILMMWDSWIMINLMNYTKLIIGVKFSPVRMFQYTNGSSHHFHQHSGRIIWLLKRVRVCSLLKRYHWTSMIILQNKNIIRGQDYLKQCTSIGFKIMNIFSPIRRIGKPYQLKVSKI